MAELWDGIDRQQPADPSLWATPSRTASYEQQSPAMWEALMRGTPEASPSLWPDAAANYDVNERAAQRIRQSARPEGGRKEGGTTQLLDALGTGAYNAAASPSRLVNAQMQGYQPGMIIGDVPEVADLVPEVAMNLVGGGTKFAQPGAAGIFGGKLAQTADHAALARAEEMTAKGVPAEQIWKDTGWFTGADNKWRFEIPDNAARFDPVATSPHRLEVAQDVFERMGLPKAGFANPKYSAETSQALKQADEEIAKRGGGELPLSNYLSHKDLFDAYPSVGEIPTTMQQGLTHRGAYQSGGGDPSISFTETIGRPGKDTLSTILHEGQHAVQDIEGFASGSNPYFLKPGTPAWDIYKERLTAMKTPLDKDTFSKVAGFGPEGATEKEYRDYLKIVKKPSPAADRAAQEYAAQSAYKRAAGEVEARNVQTRMDMTPEQLRASPPWTTQDIPTDRQFVNFRGDDPLFAASAPRDPSLWSPISDVKLSKPLSEMEHRYTDVRVPVPKIVDPKNMVGGNLVPTPWDLSATNFTATHIDNTKLPRPVVAQGGVGFPEANPGMAAASELAISRRLDNQAARLAQTGKPTYIAPITMSPTGIDASHHVADPLSQLVQMAPIKRADATAFNELMRKEVPDWVSINSPKFQDYINNLKGGMTTKSLMAEKMALREWQSKGFPDVAAVRHAMTEPSLIDVPRNTSGMAISQYIPGQGLLDTAHLSYPKGVAGQHMGQWAHLAPFDVVYPDIAKPLAEYNAALKAAGKKTMIQPAYHLGRPTEGIPTHQELTNEWLDGLMRFFEMKDKGR